MRLTDSSKTGRTCALMKKCALIRMVRLTTRVYGTRLFIFVSVQSCDLTFLNENIVHLFRASSTLALTSIKCIDRSSVELSTKFSISVDN